MGGAMSLRIHRKNPTFWDGAVLIAPMCKVSLLLLLHFSSFHLLFSPIILQKRKLGKDAGVILFLSIRKLHIISLQKRELVIDVLGIFKVTEKEREENCLLYMPVQFLYKIAILCVCRFRD